MELPKIEEEQIQISVRKELDEDEYKSQFATVLRSRKKNDEEIKLLGSKRRNLRKFYKNQNEIIDELLDSSEKKEDEELFKLKIAIYGSMIVNVCLFGLQLFAAIYSKSLSLLATMADSFMDLLSGMILLLAERASKKDSSLRYPVGKSRIETAGIIIFAVLMSALSIELIIESIQALIRKEGAPDVSLIPILCIASSLFSKFLLFLYCNWLKRYPSAKVLAQDHRNDLFVNSFGLTAAILANHFYWWIDPIGAIVVALIILRSWAATALEHSKLIVGVAADPLFISKITYTAMTHHKAIKQVDTARAYTVGNNYFVEVDIVLPEQMLLKEAHDIGETLQIKLERLTGVERAFVHLDYESIHHPEHQVVPPS